MPSSLHHNATYFREVAREILHRSYFEREQSEPIDTSWLDSVFSQLVSFIQYVVQHLLVPLFRFLQSLDHTIPGVSWFIVTILSGTLIVLSSYVIKKFFYALVERKRDFYFSEYKEASSKQLINIQNAQHAAAKGDYSLAIRLLFQLSILHLDKNSDVITSKYFTNTEYLSLFINTQFHQPLRTMTNILNRWYSDESLTNDHFQECLKAYHAIVAQQQISHS